MLKELNNYIFFDGVKEKKTTVVYDDWLSSSEFDIYSKSKIKVDSGSIELFQKNTKKIEEIYVKHKELFDQLNNSLQFTVEEKNKNNYKIYHPKHRHDSYYYITDKINDQHYIVVYSLGGSRFVESITIYKVLVYEDDTSIA